MYEKDLERKTSQLEAFKKSNISDQIKKAFPDAKLLEIVEENEND